MLYTRLMSGSAKAPGGPPGLQIQSTGQNLVGGFDSHALPPILFRGSDKRHNLVVGDLVGDFSSALMVPVPKPEQIEPP